MLRKSQSEQRDHSVVGCRKKIHFDESNLQETRKPFKIDSGFVTMEGAKEHFFKQIEPVVARELQERLQEVIDRDNKNLHKIHNDVDDDYTLKSYNLSGLATPFQRNTVDDPAARREEFYRKRRQYNLSEFTIAKQQIMNREISDPGPSIENWNNDKNAGRITSHSLSLFMNQNKLLPNVDSGIDLESLRRVTEQA